ncbi:MAG TPA: DUF1175 family protein [Pyrinomonadaceae bacterium]|nr:DUF1175 family protein [Pyrinomonadaceae bacterium]
MRPSPQAALGLIFAAALISNGCRQPAPQRAHASASRPAHAPAAERASRWADSDSDGLPDGAELHSLNDRRSFRDWFTLIAEAQSYRESDAWNESQRDCAGLVRFAWREALRRHDRAWALRVGGEYDVVPPDVRAFDLEGGPLGEKLFRTRPGAFAEQDLRDGTLSEFADARTLKEHNAEFVGRDRARAQRGDLLFFHQPFVQKYPYHVMIFVGESHRVDEEGDDWVVYHTGAGPDGAGEVRELRLSELDRHPDPRWRPLPRNRNFLGFYRLKILE